MNNFFISVQVKEFLCELGALCVLRVHYSSRRFSGLLAFLLVPALVAAASPAISTEVRFGDCLETFTCSGELEAMESADVHAPEFRDTHLMTIKSVLDDGAVVKKDDTVIQVDDAGFQNALEAANNECELARAEHERTRFELQNEGIELDLNIQRKSIDLEKARAMVVEGSVMVSRVELQKAKLGVELAQLELEQAKKARQEFEKKRGASMKVQELKVQDAERKIRLQKENIEKSAIRSPRDGIVYKPFVKLNNEMGRIEPNKVVRPGDKLLELPNLDRFQGVLYIPAADYPFIQPGNPATVTLSVLADHPFPARVVKKDLYPISRNERLGRNDPEGYLKEYKVSIEFPQKDSIFRPGLTFQAEITSIIATNCLFIPRCASLQPSSGSATILLDRSGVPEKRDILTGRSGALFMEVLSGLKSGDRVFLDLPEEETASGTPEPQN